MDDHENKLPAGAGGSVELWRVALPLVLSNAFWTLQITAGRVMLSRQNSETVGAAMSAGVLYWAMFALLHQTASYAATFVAQYLGAGRPHRVGPAIWQAIHFSLVTGMLFLLLLPFAPQLFSLSGHSAVMQELEVRYFRAISFATLPLLLIASVNSFFAGRGKTWPVLWMNVVGMVVEISVGYVLIYGYGSIPALGITGAGWATVTASWVSAIFGLVLLLRRQYRKEFATLSGWRPERALFLRLLRFGLPNGLQFSLDAWAFTIFLLLIGRMGDAELTATSMAFTINSLALVPMLGLAQGVAVLVGQRLGMNRPDIASRSAYRGVFWCLVYTLAMAAIYAFAPELLMNCFRDRDATKWEAVAAIVPLLLRFVALYCLFESMSLILSSALRGAGDTLFVSIVTLLMAWLLMVVPSIWAWKTGKSMYWSWSFATGYLIVLSFIFWARFWQGRWRTMRVIEAAPTPDLALQEA
ncbi:MAG TPA: MATE family efflux transporter [Gemmataceae bacterium]|nr:MATE family efflux transporter [Gemmataceae bacterium]